MAGSTYRTAARVLVGLNTSFPDRSAATSGCADSLCDPGGRAEAPAQRPLVAGYSGRLPRLANSTGQHRGNAAAREVVTPMPPPADQPIEEGRVTRRTRNSILVGVDGSLDSCIAAAWAVDVGRQMKASVKAVTAWSDVPPPYDGFLDDGVAELTEHTATVAAQSLLAFGLNDIEVGAAQGPTARVLINAADESDASMLVVGTRGLGPLSGLLLGSISRKLLYSSHLPVVVVPHQATIEPAPLTRVLVGAEHSPVAKRVLSWAAWFCSNVGVPATIAHCADSGCEQQPGHVGRFDGHAHSDIEQVLKPFRDLEVEYSVALTPCDPRFALPDTAARHQASLIVIGTSGAGRFRGLGSTTSYLVRRSPVPLAVIPLSGRGPS